MLLILLLAACSTPRRSDADTAERAIRASRGPNSVTVNTAETGNDLSAYLRRIAGVSVRGSGADATVRIRGDAKILGSTTPLFVINGSILGNDYGQVYDTVDINEIKRVTVLKNVSDTNLYGMQGANGVIEIELR